MGEISPRALERRELLLLNIGSPRKRLMPGVDMRVGEPRFGRSDQTIGNKRTMLPSKMTGDRGVAELIIPRQRKRVLREFIAVGYVERGGERRFFADLI